MNTIKLFLVTALASLAVVALPVNAQDVPVSTTYEVSINDLRLPETEQGTVGFKACDDCDYQQVRVTARTQYAVNGKQLRLGDFRRAIENIRQLGDVTVNVKRDELSGTVTRVYLYSQ